jgi:hypothetical protein
MNLTEDIIKMLNTHRSSPFLFIGSGFSRRYLGLETWKELLIKFTDNLRPFEYYYSSANQDLPLTATFIARDFHEAFWTRDEFELLRKRFSKKITNNTSALKYAISYYLRSLSLKGVINQEHEEEMALLHKLNVDGIITTNWDTLIEEILPDYKVFVGQDELLFSNPQSIGEIYKIHGCITQPDTLVLTNDDYQSFRERNAYLAAKLITLFIEHPIIFIGYSLGDSNIRDLLRSIVLCLGKDKISELHNNLIFIQRTHKGELSQITQSIMVIDDIQLPISIIKTDSFSPVYIAINTIERKIPTRILRYCKEQIFDLVRNEVPQKKFCVVDFDSIEDKSDIEFVVGIGVIDKHHSKIGYQGIKATDLFEDLIVEDKKFDANSIISNTLNSLQGNIPIYKYLVALGINSKEKYKSSCLNLDLYLKTPLEYQHTPYRKSYMTNAYRLTVDEIITMFPAEKVCLYLPFSKINNDDLESIRVFLNSHFDEFMQKPHKYRTYYRKLACCYDYYKYSW